MYRIDTADAVTPKPARPAQGSSLWFQDTDPSGGTILPAWWCNMMQDEIIAVLVAGSITPDKTNDGQLLLAINAIVAAATSTSLKYHVHYASTSTSALSTGAYTLMPYATLVNNTDSQTMSSNVYTSLGAGIHSVVASFEIVAGSINLKHLRIKVVTAARGTEYFEGNDNLDVGTVSLNVSCLVELAVGDTIEVEYWSGGAATFSGQTSGNFITIARL